MNRLFRLLPAWLVLTAVCFGGHSSRSHIRRHKLVSPIAGSHQSQLNQNAEIDRLKLPRIVDDNQLEQLERDGELVRIPDNRYIALAPNIQDNKRYVREWTLQFVSNTAKQYKNVFGVRLQINSAVRTEEQQREIAKHNRYAAPPKESSHVAGVTVDLAKQTLTLAQRRWLVAYLEYCRDMGLIEVAEEPYCYHVAVKEIYNEYAEKP